MIVEQVVEKFLENPSRMEMGSGKLSKRYKCERDDIFEARVRTRKILKENEIKRLPNVLVFDIETSPLMAYVWQSQVWNAQISLDKVISEWFMLTWSAKWLFSNKIMSARLTGKEAKDEDDSRIVKEFWSLLDEADIVIAHNGDRFDVPNMNTRFLVNGLSPTSPYQSIDTVKIARRQFGFTHNNLNALARVFGFEAKIDTDFELWKRCLDGNEEALKYMETYNIHDVELLEEVYMKLRPWVKSHPSLALYSEIEDQMCPNCGNTELEQDGHYYTSVGKYRTHKCNKCGSYCRERTSILPKAKKQNLLVPLAR